MTLASPPATIVFRRPRRLEQAKQALCAICPDGLFCSASRQSRKPIEMRIGSCRVAALPGIPERFKHLCAPMENGRNPQFMSAINLVRPKQRFEHPSASAPRSRSILAQAQQKLRESSYPAHRRLRCSFHEGVLTLSGRVSSFHQRQVACQLMADVAGVEELADRMEVVEIKRRARPNRRAEAPALILLRRSCGRWRRRTRTGPESASPRS